jgi:hypothetical protein
VHDDVAFSGIGDRARGDTVFEMVRDGQTVGRIGVAHFLDEVEEWVATARDCERAGDREGAERARNRAREIRDALDAHDIDRLYSVVEDDCVGGETFDDSRGDAWFDDLRSVRRLDSPTPRCTGLRPASRSRRRARPRARRASRRRRASRAGPARPRRSAEDSEEHDLAICPGRTPGLRRETAAWGRPFLRGGCSGCASVAESVRWPGRRGCRGCRRGSPTRPRFLPRRVLVSGCGASRSRV